MHRQGQGAPALRVRRQGKRRDAVDASGRRPVRRPRHKALPGNPDDGHTLATVIPDLEQTIGVTLRRIVADRGYRGHNAPPDSKFRVYIAGQKRRVTAQIKRELRRRAAVEPVIGHLKAEHRMDRNHLAGRAGDAINAVLAAAGYNFGLLLRWLASLLRIVLAFLIASARPHSLPATSDPRSSRTTMDIELGATIGARIYG